MSESNQSVLGKIGVILARAVVPAWVLTGAVFKLAERNPANLPQGIREIARGAAIDLHILLAVLISLEILAAAVMMFIPRLSRAAAAFMLSVFCLVLLNEMRIGNFTSCGCLGDIPIKPWQMLTIDGLLLVGVITLGWRRSPGVQRAVGRIGFAAAAVMFIAGSAASFGLILPERAAPIAKVDPANPLRPDVTPTADPTVNPNPQPVPPSYYIRPSADAWVGQGWRDIDLFQVMPKWPKIAPTGTHIVVFYSRTCEHCEAMFLDHLSGELETPVTAIEIPISKTEMHDDHAWEMPQTKCELMELPLGCQWIITPPLALTIVDGKVTCAVEGQGFEACLASQ